jgi:YVTN family beta-propeller protein
VIDDDQFPGRQGRLLFAYLVAEEGRPVPRDELADALWGETPPATWDKALTVVASKLRATLADHGIDGADALTGAFGCYRLRLPEGTWVDVIAAANAAQEAEDALATGDFERAKAAAALAASLVAQPFLPGEVGGWAEEKRRQFADIRTRALSALADACLRSGDAPQAAKWAEQTVALAPLRETGYRRLMDAHVAAGNRAEALHVYERCRRLLAEELGTYPSPETESIYRGLLEVSSPWAAVATAAEPPTPPTAGVEPASMPAARRRWASRTNFVAAAAVILGAAGVVVAGVEATSGGEAHAKFATNSVVALAPSGSIAATVPVGARPVALAPAAGALWVANLVDQTVTRVAVPSGRAVRSVPIGGAPTALAATKSALWVTDGSGNVSKLDPRYDRVVLRRRLAFARSGFYGASAPRPTLAAFGSVWVVNPDGFVSRMDARTGRRLASVDVGNDPSAIAAGAGSIWVTNRADGTVTRIDPATLVTTTIPVGHGPAGVAVGDGVWIANAADDAVVRVDVETNARTGFTNLGESPTAILATPTALWVTTDGGAVMRLDPRSGRVRQTIRLGGTPDALAAFRGQLWVAVAPAPPLPPAAGGTARVTLQDDIPSLDPALDLRTEFTYATCVNLVTHPDKPGALGSRMVPEVAESVPAPTDGGRTYTFRIRAGFRFSPPSEEAVAAATFKSTIERVANPRMKSPYAHQLSEVVGYRAYVSGKANGLAGVIAHGRTLTIRLARPDGGFLANLAGGSACAVPRGTPVDPHGIDDIPSAGPYYIASYTPGQQLVLKRNPNYHGGRPRRLDRIVVAIGVDGSRALEEIKSGRADYALDGLPRDAGPRLESEYGPGSKAAKEGHQQYIINAADATRYLHMNASRPLFANVRLRRAVNFVIDRPALVAQGRRFAEGNPFNAGKPTDDYLPPATEGATDFHLYPLDGPNLRRARRIAGRVHATAIMYTPNVPPWQQEAQVVRRDLKPLGIDVDVKEMPLGEYFARLDRPGEPYDLAVSGWNFANADPGMALGMFVGTHHEPLSGPNFSHLHDATFDRDYAAATKLSGPKRYRAYRLLAFELERDDAPVAAFSVNASRDFFSARIGCQLYQPLLGIDLAALCVRHATSAR